MAKLSPLPDRLERIVTERDGKAALAALFEHPAIEEFMTTLRSELVESILKAGPTEDSKRRDLAAQAVAIDRLTVFLKQAGGDAARAAETYAKLTKDNGNG